MLELVYTNKYEEACRLRDQGFEPIECAFGQYGSVMGEFEMDHHGTESHREGVALRACRDLYGARKADPRFVVTGTPDADAVLAIIALAELIPAEKITPAFYELVDEHDTDPIGKDLLATREGERLAWFNQREGLTQSSAGFRKAIGHMSELLERSLAKGELEAVRKADRNRRRKALEGILGRLAADGTDLPIGEVDGRPVCRGEAAMEGAARVLVVQSKVWGFDQWYRLAPVVVSYAQRMAKVTVGCPDKETAELIFGPGGLANVWPELGKGWGGRETIGGSPRGQRLGLSAVHDTARRVLELL